MAPLLRYRHMTPDFVTIIVLHNTFMGLSRLRGEMLLSAFCQRSVPPAVVQVTTRATCGSVNRGVPPSETSWQFSATFELEELAEEIEEKGDYAHFFCGSVAGYVTCVTLEWNKREDNPKAFVGFFFSNTRRAAG